jgi:hypothetical protein
MDYFSSVIHTNLVIQWDFKLIQYFKQSKYIEYRLTDDAAHDPLKPHVLGLQVENRVLRKHMVKKSNDFQHEYHSAYTAREIDRTKP